jgi:methyltransferase (TIGR00027 family)
MAGSDMTHELLGATAYWAAGVRALESAREDRLFNDPWAAALAGPQGMAWAAERGANSIPMVIRTRYFDDFLRRVVTDFGVRQVVIPAAGLDTRAFRLGWLEGARLFELDQAAVLQYKQQILQAAGATAVCERHTIEVDLNSPWEVALLDSGYALHRPAVWLLEGFLFYLSNQHISQLLEKASGLAAPGSWIGFDIVNTLTLTSQWTRSWVEMQAAAGAPWLGTMDDPEAVLAGLGWKPALTQPGAGDAGYGRWTLPVIPLKMAGMPHHWYVTGWKE